MKLLGAALVVVGLFLHSAQAQNLPRLPPRGEVISEKVWSDYSRKVLKILFPTRRELIAKLAVEIDSDDKVLDATTFYHKIVITTGLIRAMANEDQFAAILGHEVSHRMMAQSRALRPRKDPAEFTLDGFNVVDWQQDRKNEMEADFGSVLVAFHPEAVSKILDAMIPNAVLRNISFPPARRIGVASSLLMRQASLDQLLRQTDPVRIVAAHSLPAALPVKDARVEEWERYVREVLYAAYPQHHQFLEKITIEGWHTRPEVSMESDRNGGTLSFSTNFMSEVLRSSEDAAVLLGHEFGHALFQRNYDPEYHNAGVEETISETRFRREWEADMVGILPIHRGECHLADVLERILATEYVKVQLDDDTLKLNQERIRRLRQMCEENY